MQNNSKTLALRMLTMLTALALYATMSGATGDIALTAPDVYYTAVNLWCNDPRAILSTNYHIGEIIPLGTKVTILTKSLTGISFETEDQKKYAILHVRRHSRITLDELFDRLFTEADALTPDGAFFKLTKDEQKAVSRGVVFKGMTKTAVLMAYGYPPSHKTPKLDGNIWVYWTSRRRNVKIYFNSENKVESIKGLIEGLKKKG